MGWYNESMQRVHGVKTLRSALVLLCGVTFLAAANHCGLEACAGHHSEEPGGHHHGESSPAHDSCPDQQVMCCSSLYATPFPKIEIKPGWVRTGFLETADVLAPFLRISPTSANIVTGLSPPLQEVIPRVCFYRSTFASHAPPVFLS